MRDILKVLVEATLRPDPFQGIRTGTNRFPS